MYIKVWFYALSGIAGILKENIKIWYTIERINTCNKVLGKKFIGIFDRGYDSNQIINYMNKSNR